MLASRRSPVCLVFGSYIFIGLFRFWVPSVRLEVFGFGLCMKVQPGLRLRVVATMTIATTAAAAGSRTQQPQKKCRQ